MLYGIVVYWLLPFLGTLLVYILSLKKNGYSIRDAEIEELLLVIVYPIYYLLIFAQLVHMIVTSDFWTKEIFKNESRDR